MTTEMQYVLVNVSLHDEYSLVRDAAVDAIRQLGSQMATETQSALVNVLLCDKSYSVRKAAVDAIGQLGSQMMMEMRSVIVNVSLHHKNFRVRDAAVDVIEQLDKWMKTKSRLTLLSLALQNHTEGTFRRAAIAHIIKSMLLSEDRLVIEEKKIFLYQQMGRESVGGTSKEAIYTLKLEFEAQRDLVMSC
eukprot:jgi/Bigna1/143620/aug1.80_g18328